MPVDQWFPVVTLVVGAVLAFGGGFARDLWSSHRTRQQAEADRLVRLVGESLLGAQWCGSIFFKVARNVTETVGITAPENSQTYGEMINAISIWNTAQYQLHVVGGRNLVALVRAIDEEVSAMYELSIVASTTEQDLETRRRQLGVVMAEYLDEARSDLSKLGTGLELLELPTVWKVVPDGAHGSPISPD